MVDTVDEFDRWGSQTRDTFCEKSKIESEQKKSMRIGIGRSSADIGQGGVFQYEKAFLDALSEVAPRFADKFVYLAHYQGDLAALARTGGLNYRGLTIHPLDQTASRQMVPEAYIQEKPGTHLPIDPNRVYFDRKGADLIRSAGIDLILQLGPGSSPFSLRLPFVVPIFDLNHRLQRNFQR